jgi:CxxC-x17-CxxC domain-containing protein
MYDVTCQGCGKETQVPFKPTGQKPVLCRECFNKERDG